MVTTFRAHFHSQDNFFRCLHRQQSIPVTDPLHYQQAQINLKPRCIHLSLLSRLTSLWNSGITEWSQLALRATCTKLILKPAAHRRDITDVVSYAVRAFTPPCRDVPLVTGVAAVIPGAGKITGNIDNNKKRLTFRTSTLVGVLPTAEPASYLKRGSFIAPECPSMVLSLA
jgi:hypothetical protein